MGLVGGLTAQGRNAWLPEREGGRLRRGGGRLGEPEPYLEGGIEEAALSRGGAGLVGSESQSPTTGDAGSGDPAYREAAGSEMRPYFRVGNRVISPSKPA